MLYAGVVPVLQHICSSEYLSKYCSLSNHKFALATPYCDLLVKHSYPSSGKLSIQALQLMLLLYIVLTLCLHRLHGISLSGYAQLTEMTPDESG